MLDPLNGRNRTMKTYHFFLASALVAGCESPAGVDQAPTECPSGVVRPTEEDTLAELAACCGHLAVEHQNPCSSMHCGERGECIELAAPLGQVCAGDPAFATHGRCVKGSSCLWQDWGEPTTAPWTITKTTCTPISGCPQWDCHVAICHVGACAYAALPPDSACPPDGT